MWDKAMEFGLSALNIGANAVGWWGARQANVDRYEEAKGLAQERMRYGMEAYGQGAQNLMGGYGQMAQGVLQGPGGYGQVRAGMSPLWQQRTAGLGEMYGERAATLGAGYTARTQTAIQQLGGLGEAERQQLGQQWTEREAEMRQGLRRTGMGGTTVESAMSMGAGRERGLAFGALEERLRGQRVGIEAGLRGEELAGRAGLTGEALGARGQLSGQEYMARQQLAGMHLGAHERMGGAGLGAYERMLQQGMQWGTGLSGEQLRIIESRQDAYPPQSQLPQQFGYYSQPPPWG